MLDDAADARVSHLVLTPCEKGHDFQISSIGRPDQGDPDWHVHMTGHILASENQDQQERGETLFSNGHAELHGIDPSAEQVSGDDFYALQAENGYVLGPTFRWLECVWFGKNKAIALLRQPLSILNGAWHGLHPGLIDSCLQVTSRMANRVLNIKGTGVLVPAAISGFRLAADRVTEAVKGDMYCRISPVNLDERNIVFKVSVFDQSGKPVFSITKFHLRHLSSDDLLPRSHKSWDSSLRHIVWSDAPLAASPPVEQGRWLILADEGATGASLAELLRGRGQDVAVVLKAQEHAKNGHYLRLSEDDQPAFNRQLAQLHADWGTSWQGIIYLWGLDSENKPPTEGLIEDESSACVGLLSLARVMISNVDCPPVWVVTRGAQRTQRESRLGAIGQAMLWGFGRVFASEHSALFGGLIDLDPHASHEDAAQIFDELSAQDGETQVAYRTAKRLVPRLNPLKITTRKFRARNDASYLITGGFGAIGRKVAEWLVASGARHLALLGRHLPDDNGSRWVQELRSRGVQVLPLQADVSVITELADALALVDRTMPALRGVMHAAGVLEDTLLSKLEWPSFARVQAPKAYGSWNLHTLTLDRPLDFWVVFSSISAVLGNPGQAAYAAGNAYADALVQYRRIQGLPALTINWGPWKGDGMSSQVIHDLYQRWGLLAIEPAEGVEMLGQLLNNSSAQALAAPLDVDVLKKRSAESLHLSLMAELVDIQKRRVPSSTERITSNGNGFGRLRDLPDDQRQAALLEHVVELVRSVTGMNGSEPVRVDVHFEVLGVDSLLTVDLLNALGRSFGVTLPATILIDCPTIERLVKYLFEETAKSVAVS
ncbi:MAG: type I polyketide synthase, partial [Candidatus Angelobacter sp.]